MNIKTVLNSIWGVYLTSRANRYPLLASYWRFMQLAKYGLYSPTEILAMDLLDPTMSDHELSKLISKESFLRFQHTLNPSSHHHLTENKIDFNDHCRAHQLPVPDLIAVIRPDGQSYWARDGKALSIDHIGEDLKKYPFELICKPVGGCHGIGISSFRYSNQRHTSHPDHNITLQSFIQNLLKNSSDGYIIQKKVFAHQDIADFTGNPNAQSLRIETFIDHKGEPQIFSISIKFPEKGSIVDNFVLGASKSRLCYATDSGVVYCSIEYCTSRRKLVLSDYVRNDKGEMVNFQLPLWDECVALAFDAQLKFAPLNTIGWDIAITDDGPVLIEGNVFWDPPLRQQGAGLDLLTTMKIPFENKNGISRYQE